MKKLEIPGEPRMTQEELVSIRKKNFGEIKQVRLAPEDQWAPLHGRRCTCKTCWEKVMTP